jgi:hypothetical protein
MRISISCLRCRVWFDSFQDLLVHRPRHDLAPGLGSPSETRTGPAGLPRSAKVLDPRRPANQQAADQCGAAGRAASTDSVG